MPAAVRRSRRLLRAKCRCCRGPVEPPDLRACNLCGTCFHRDCVPDRSCRGAAWRCISCRLLSDQDEKNDNEEASRRRKRKRQLAALRLRRKRQRMEESLANSLPSQPCDLCGGQCPCRDVALAGGCRRHGFHAACLMRHADSAATAAAAAGVVCPGRDCDVEFAEIVLPGRPVGSVPIGSGTVCPICREALAGASARPDGCRHVFCHACLAEWCRRSRTCPLDRAPFGRILVAWRLGERPVAAPAPELSLPPLDEEVDNASDYFGPCLVCGQSDRAHEMEICDHCDASYHFDCLLQPVPPANGDDLWLCPDCSATSSIEELTRSRRHAAEAAASS